MKVVTIVGARPQFIKAAPVSKALRRSGHSEFFVHTGQHYDYKLSGVFFDELDMAAPSVNLGIGSGAHGWQTGRMLVGIEEVLQNHRPDWVLVFGDTNSTLAGALAACKLRIPVAHVEAGLRSFNREMPEEYNRLLTDHCSDLLFCPTPTAVQNLAREGITGNVHLVGDTMYDAVLEYAEIARKRSTILHDLDLRPRQYLLATIHRPYNTDSPDKLVGILAALMELGSTVIIPLHPRTRQRMSQSEQLFKKVLGAANLKFIEPVSYIDMLALEQNAKRILTDSGGMQKEAFFLGVPCVTLRPEIEWVETVSAGWNIIADVQPENILRAVRREDWPTPERTNAFGAGDAAARIVAVLVEAGAMRSQANIGACETQPEQRTN